MDSSNVSEYYDSFATYEEEVGINARHLTILSNLKKAGLKRNSTVFEIGSGIGQMTGLIAKTCPDGKILSVDISPRSIEQNKKKNAGYSHIDYAVTDMQGFSDGRKFDVILLPDVLEHIPMTQHPELFSIIRNHMHQDSFLGINIPDPFFLEYYAKYNPKELQIIDQPLPMSHISSVAYGCGLYLDVFSRYCLFHTTPDYQWIVFRPKKEYYLYAKKSSLQRKFEKLKKRFL